MRRRLGIAVATGALGLLVLAGCGVGDPDTYQQALDMSGLSTVDNTSASPAPSGSPAAGTGSKAGHARGIRRELRRNVLHGQVVVRTKEGTQTVAVQRGQITAVSPTSLTVKSTDGFSQTWQLGKDTRVRVDKKKSDAAALKVNQQVGVAGTASGGTSTAKLVVVTG